MELNAEQIKKALECCANNACTQCYHKQEYECIDLLASNALTLIKELTEENERLRKLNDEGAECPTCHGIGKIDTTNWLTKHLSKEQIAKEKAEAVAEYHRELKADTVRKMQERIKAEKFHHKNFGDLVYLADIDRIAKEMIENDNKRR